MWHIAIALFILTLGCAMGAETAAMPLPELTMVETATKPPTNIVMYDGYIDIIGRVSCLRGKPTEEELAKVYRTDYTEPGREHIVYEIKKQLELLEEKYGTNYRGEE